MLLWIPLWRVSSNKRKRFYSAHRKGIPHRCSINNSALIKTEHRSFLSSVHVVNLSTRSRAFNKITRSANPVQLRGRPHPTPRQSGATPSTRTHSENHTAQKRDIILLHHIGNITRPTAVDTLLKCPELCFTPQCTRKAMSANIQGCRFP